jgi:hypothetical protein
MGLRFWRTCVISGPNRFHWAPKWRNWYQLGYSYMFMIYEWLICKWWRRFDRIPFAFRNHSWTFICYCLEELYIKGELFLLFCSFPLCPFFSCLFVFFIFALCLMFFCVSNVLCHNPNLGLVTKARACKGAGQEGSPRVTSRAPGNVGECEVMTPHTPKGAPILEVGASVDSLIFREWL